MSVRRIPEEQLQPPGTPIPLYSMPNNPLHNSANASEASPTIRYRGPSFAYLKQKGLERQRRPGPNNPGEPHKSLARSARGRAFEGEDSSTYRLSADSLRALDTPLTFEDPPVYLPEIREDYLYQSVSYWRSTNTGLTCRICKLNVNRIIEAWHKVREDEWEESDLRNHEVYADQDGPFWIKVAKENRAVPEYSVDRCSHEFHEHCLFGWLLQTDDEGGSHSGEIEGNWRGREREKSGDMECSECEELRKYVKKMGWSPEELGSSMDRVYSRDQVL